MYRERTKRKLSQQKVIDYINERLGTNLRQGSLSAWERGKVQAPDAAALAVLDELYGFPRGYLLDLAGEGRGANRRRALQAPPEPNSIIFPPSDGLAYRVAKWIDSATEEQLSALLILVEH
ncbi:MAG: hypothetical protein U0031_18695 [Thermomicrobiales bacterium]